MQYTNLTTIDYINTQPSNFKTNEFVTFWIGSNSKDFKSKYDKHQLEIRHKVVQELCHIFDQQSLGNPPYYDDINVEYLYNIIESNKHNKNIFKIIIDTYIKLYLSFENKGESKKTAIESIGAITQKQISDALVYIADRTNNKEIRFDKNELNDFIQGIKLGIQEKIGRSLIQDFPEMQNDIDQQVAIKFSQYIIEQKATNDEIYVSVHATLTNHQ